MNMNIKRKLLLSILFAVMILPMGVSIVTMSINDDVNNFAISDGEDAAIYITSNADFSTFAVNGTGVLSDPYIISGFNLSSHGYADVYVANTDAVFILENFNISHNVHENEGYGIYFENVTNALIRDGNIVGKEHSIWLSYCENVRVARMYISNRVPGFDDGISNFDLITASGVLVEGGRNIEIRNNNIVRVKVGVHLLDSLNARVTGNTFRYSCVSLVGGSGEPMNYIITSNMANDKPIVYAYNITNGVYSGAAYGQIILDHCEHIAVEYANLSWVTIGLEINHCYEIRIKDSNMTRNWIGINAYMSEAIEILRCRVEYNMIGGHVWDTHNISIRDSSFAHNREKGVWLDLMTSYATVFGNVFLNNTINAVDDGISDTYPPTSDTGFIEVKIVDSYYRTPLSEVNVTLSNVTHSHSIITDFTGAFNFSGLALGTYNLSCTKDGYFENETILTLTNISWSYDFEVYLTPIEAPLYRQAVCVDIVEFEYTRFILSEEPIRMANRWFDNGVGNYWDTYHGVGSYGVVNREGELANYDLYPLDEMPEIYLELELEPEPEREPESWSDSLEIYESEAPDGRIDVNSFGVAKWKVRWTSNGTEIVDELTMMIRVNGSEVDELLLAEYVDGWWIVSYNHTEPALLEFSVYSVNSYNMTEFVQLAENVEIIWDRIVIIAVITNTDIITDTTSDTTSTESITTEEFELNIFLVILGMSIATIIVVILYIIRRK